MIGNEKICGSERRNGSGNLKLGICNNVDEIQFALIY